MVVRLDDPQYWLARAEEARLYAEQIADFGSKAALFRIAVGYERGARCDAYQDTSAAIGGEIGVASATSCDLLGSFGRACLAN